jgi:hypothetical protein
MGDKRCCPERQTLLCSVCHHTLAWGFGPGVGEPSDAVVAKRQTLGWTLLLRLSHGRVAVLRDRRVHRPGTGRV